MKKLLFTMLIFTVLFTANSFAITQKVNEVKGINYGYIKDVTKKDGVVYLGIDYIQLYQGQNAVLAKIEDDQCTSTDEGGTIADKEDFYSFVEEYDREIFMDTINELFNITPEKEEKIFSAMGDMERSMYQCSSDPARGYGGRHARNESTKIRYVRLSNDFIAYPLARHYDKEDKIRNASSEQGSDWTALQLYNNFINMPNSFTSLTRVNLKKGKINRLREIYQP